MPLVWKAKLPKLSPALQELLELCPEIMQRECFPSCMGCREEAILRSNPNTSFLMVFLVFYNNSRAFSTDIDTANAKQCTYVVFKQGGCLPLYQ